MALIQAIIVDVTYQNITLYNTVVLFYNNISYINKVNLKSFITRTNSMLEETPQSISIETTVFVCADRQEINQKNKQELKLKSAMTRIGIPNHLCQYHHCLHLRQRQCRIRRSDEADLVKSEGSLFNNLRTSR